MADNTLDMRELLEARITEMEDDLASISPESKEYKAITENLNTLYQIRLKEYGLDNEATALVDKGSFASRELKLKERELDIRERELEQQDKKNKHERIWKYIDTGIKGAGTLGLLYFGGKSIKMEYCDGMTASSGFLRSLNSKVTNLFKF